MAAHNESETIGSVLEQIQSVGMVDEIVVVDDCSGDETYDIARRNKCKVIRNRRRLGQTRSLRCGLEEASGDYVVTMDADLDHLPRDIPVLLNCLAINSSDIVIGKRSSLPRFSEKLMSRVLRNYAGITDMISGFRVISRQALAMQEFDVTETWGIIFLLGCKRKRLSISEIPIITPPRRLTGRTGSSLKSNFLVLKALIISVLYLSRIIQ
jgi:glycosyltransferase involved in cell wall biosynthesis